MIEVSRQHDVSVIELGPSYESLDACLLEDVGGVLLGEASRADPPRMVLDMTGTRYVGSAFIELLVRAWKRLTERGGTMVLCGVQPLCAEVLRVTGLNRLWKALPTRDQAVVAARTAHEQPSP